MFVVILRKPVERFRAACYWYYNSAHFGQQRDDKHRHAHNRTLAMEIALLSSTLPPTFGLVRTAWSELQTTALDTFTRTMYFLNWRPWLEQFEARQFVVFPMDYALQNVSRATSMVSTHFRATGETVLLVIRMAMVCRTYRNTHTSSLQTGTVHPRRAFLTVEYGGTVLFQ